MAYSRVPVNAADTGSTVPAHTLYGTRQDGSGGVTNVVAEGNVQPVSQPMMRRYQEPAAKQPGKYCSVMGCRAYRTKADPNNRCAGHAGLIGGRKHGAGMKRKIQPNEIE